LARLAVDSRALILLLAAIGSINPLATDMYLPTLPSVRDTLSASTAQAQATLSFFLIGAVAGQFVIGPLSDHWGRRPFILGCLVIFGGASLACMLAPSIEFLIVARIVQAVGAGGVMTLSRTVVRDLHDGWAASRQFARMNTIRGVTPLLAPMLGAVLASWFGWRAIFAFMAMAGLVIALIVMARLPETLKRPEGGLSFGRILRDFAEVLRNPRFRFYCGIQTLQFAGFFGFLSGSSFVLQGAYGLTQGQYAIGFSVAVLGFIGGSYLAHRLQGRMSPTAIIRMGVILAFSGGIGTLIAMSFRVGGAPAVVVASAFYLLGMAVASPYCEAGALSPFSGKVGSAASLIAIVQMLFAAVTGLILGRALDTSILALPAAEVAATSLALIMIVCFRPDKTTG
jgi:DHA1 family bicyclomycin/chloramphenicol resistance-like MFS transporter